MSQLSPNARAVVRAAEQMTTQLRRIADALTTPVVRTEVVADDDMPTRVGGARRAVIAAALTAEHYRRAEAGIVASPEEHCAAMADAVMGVLTPDAADDATTPVDGPTALRDMAATLRYIDPQGFRQAADCCESRAFAIEHGQAQITDTSTPATTCSAQYRGPDYPPTECIRAAQHQYPQHTDSSGFHWCDALAMYPASAEPQCESRAPAADEDAQRTARRRSIGTLLARAAAGLTPDEDALLRQHVEAETREGSAARVKLDEAQATIRDLTRMLRAAEAAIERVRALRQPFPMWRDIAAALDGTGQPGTKED
ncbi:hypothetical protein GTY23_23250 [Streptomyces sp. SID5998]|nr:hypothetical protein [Streptomyces sp. SID5998]